LSASKLFTQLEEQSAPIPENPYRNFAPENDLHRGNPYGISIAKLLIAAVCEL
jgi:hypothetical protein